LRVSGGAATVKLLRPPPAAAKGVLGGGTSEAGGPAAGSPVAPGRAGVHGDGAAAGGGGGGGDGQCRAEDADLGEEGQGRHSSGGHAGSARDGGSLGQSKASGKVEVQTKVEMLVPPQSQGWLAHILRGGDATELMRQIVAQITKEHRTP
jgi:hypothetical protein